jgi:hypothetical protein
MIPQVAQRGGADLEPEGFALAARPAKGPPAVASAVTGRNVKPHRGRDSHWHLPPPTSSDSSAWTNARALTSHCHALDGTTLQRPSSCDQDALVPGRPQAPGASLHDSHGAISLESRAGSSPAGATGMSRLHQVGAGSRFFLLVGADTAAIPTDTDSRCAVGRAGGLPGLVAKAKIHGAMPMMP